jgi:pimeloyl-ACP methyl ester carboxylesterase
MTVSMTEIEIESFDGVRIRAYRSSPATARGHLVIALPLATRPSLCARAIASLAGELDVVTWEPRLILEPEVALRSRAALAIEAHVKDVLAILDHLGIEQAALLGYCSGAATALYAAAENRKRFCKLALVSGAYFMNPDRCEHTQYERDVLALAPSIAADRTQAGRLFSQFFSGNRGFRRRDHELADEIYRPYDNPESFYRFGVCVDSFMRGDPERAAGEIVAPTLVTSGALDDQTHPASSALVAARISHRETYCDPQGDHYELCRANAGLMTRVARFVASA